MDRDHGGKNAQQQQNIEGKCTFLKLPTSAISDSGRTGNQHVLSPSRLCLHGIQTFCNNYLKQSYCSDSEGILFGLLVGYDPPFHFLARRFHQNKVTVI